jgi:membrane protein
MIPRTDRAVPLGQPAGKPRGSIFQPAWGLVGHLQSLASFVKQAVIAWAASKTPRLGAALAYYTVFAIAPLFLLTMSVAGFWFGQDTARQDLFNQINGLVGEEGGRAIQSLVTAAGRPEAGLWATTGAITTLGAGAMAVFVELQDALNVIWGVQRPPGRRTRAFIKDRALSFAMVLGIGFLLLVSLVLNAALAGLGKYASGGVQDGAFWEVVNFLVSLAVITALFAMIYKILPDVSIAWRNVWMGAFVTALLFNLGKFLIGYYLGRSTLVSVYGAAGSFIVLLLWVYYSAQILFFGAVLTRLIAERNGVPGKSLTACPQPRES